MEKLIFWWKNSNFGLWWKNSDFGGRSQIFGGKTQVLEKKNQVLVEKTNFGGETLVLVEGGKTKTQILEEKGSF